MKISTDAILTTHVGSLPRPQDVTDLVFSQERGEDVDQSHFEQVIERAVADTLSRQKQARIDFPSDGEMSKISYATA